MQQQFRTSITQLNRRFNALLKRARGPQHWGRGRKLLVACALALCLGAPAFAVVQGTFSDVPPTAFYYNAVEAIYHAGITSGCATGLYCPDNTVTRGQMAVFMHRGFGRVHYNWNNGVGLPTDKTPVIIAQVSIDTTDSAPGQKVFVKLDGTLTARVHSGFCSGCSVKYAIVDANGLLGSVDGTVTLFNGEGESGAATWALEVPTGAKRTFRLVAFINQASANADISVRGSLTAITAPFGTITPPAP
jgi:hypothetical protein